MVIATDIPIALHAAQRGLFYLRKDEKNKEAVAHEDGARTL